ncbi:OBERON-like protein [Argentina anserina]|uniref:OBERON-like protein n=1 Tax=Argentina anserina TaxID=57926 RepID=UPI0021765B35|nr:OBERON-like protein [Potentilla anserina]
MEIVADEKMRMYKKAQMAVEACDRELQDKARKVQELKLERQKKKQQVEELEKIVRLKNAEADMFQLKANEAKRQADRIQRIALAKSDKSEEEYASSYLKQRLSEVEAEKQFIYEKIKLQETSRASQNSGGSIDPSQMLMYSKMHDLLYSGAPKSDCLPNEHHPFKKKILEEVFFFSF